jgi:hypothetical protein
LSEAANTDKILPRITSDNRPFWDALREGRFVSTRCADCERVSFPPRLLCPSCFSAAREWIELTGRGVLYAFTRHHIVPRAYIGEAPYITAMVDLEEGPRILTRIENARYEDLAIGQPVKIGYKQLTNEITFFFFEPA